MKVNITGEKKNNENLSIIIPSYNEKQRLKDLVEFILSYADKRVVEIIIVDANLSTDHIENLSFEGRIKIIKSDATCRSKQLQLGAEQSNGDLLCFLHADTFPPKEFVNHIVKMLNTFDFGMFSYQFDQKKWNLKFNGWMTQWKGFYTGGGDQGLFLKRETYNLVGGYDSTLTIMEDYDLFWRLKKGGLKYSIIKDPATVSSRKYQRNRGIKVNIVNLVTLIGFKLSGNTVKWGAFYNRHIQ